MRGQTHCLMNEDVAVIGSQSSATAWGRLTIDLAALAQNYRLLRDRAAPAACAGVVKADAYGLGARPVSAALYAEGCRHFFVAHLSEGLDLRAHLPTDAAIYVLNGLLPGTEQDCAASNIIPVVNSVAQFYAWTDLAMQLGQKLGQKLPTVIQVDTGMSRLGLASEDAARVAKETDRLGAIDLRYVMSHLACAEQIHKPANDQQLAAFRRLKALFPQAGGSLANSSGIFLGADYHFDLVRPGAALYGLSPVEDGPNPMAAVVQLEVQVIQTRHIQAGQSVGYGYTATAPGPMRLATVSVGYADGWLRSLSSRGAAYYNDLRLPIVGRVSMDSMTIDIGALPEDMPDAFRVDLIGPYQTADDVARDSGTIGYEILTSLGQRYARRYVGG